MLRKTRARDAATRFVNSATEVTGGTPARVTTAGHTSYPQAIRPGLGRKVVHRTNRYLNNRLAQDHRGVKQRYYPIHARSQKKR